jgi:hypothetical protein
MSQNVVYTAQGATAVPEHQRRAAEIVLEGLSALERAQVIETIRPAQGFPVFEPLGRALRASAAGTVVHLADRIPGSDALGETFSDDCKYGPLVAEWALARLTPAQRAEIERAVPSASSAAERANGVRSQKSQKSDS